MPRSLNLQLAQHLAAAGRKLFWVLQGVMGVAEFERARRQLARYAIAM